MDLSEFAQGLIHEISDIVDHEIDKTDEFVNVTDKTLRHATSSNTTKHVPSFYIERFSMNRIVPNNFQNV